MAGLRIAVSLLLLATACSAQSGPRVAPVEGQLRKDLHVLPMHVGGRAVLRENEVLRQWPGTYFETAFNGTEIYFRVGEGEQKLHVRLDGQVIQTLMRPAAGLYALTGLAKGPHRLAVEVASESQAGPTAFGGFFAPASTKASNWPARTRQIEFIGDSHTVGYGNTSATRQCTEQEVWETTDTSHAFGPILARRYAADYEVNAISGRGVVRSYDGAAVDSLPTIYPYVLFNRDKLARDATWQPSLIVISLGTNDFSTQLHPDEKWRSRKELSADFRSSYVAFVKRLRAANPDAQFVVWTTDAANGEIAAEVRSAVEDLKAAGEKRIDFVEIAGLEFGGCNYHPSVADDRRIAERLAVVVDAHGDVWRN
ncbi:SGNH/GDSL hydrolase family protein [Sphingomonas daechungensis]|uniref:SGNH/GDSL hydrolase family protein n=1 Tax=Sphingomonas daechungensis TaxID=1176646 RepID=UPI0031E530D5